MTTPDDHFRNQADDCKRLAGRALKPVDKAFWLRLAAYWLELGEKAGREGPTEEHQAQQRTRDHPALERRGEAGPTR